MLVAKSSASEICFFFVINNNNFFFVISNNEYYKGVKDMIIPQGTLSDHRIMRRGKLFIPLGLEASRTGGQHSKGGAKGAGLLEVIGSWQGWSWRG